MAEPSITARDGTSIIALAIQAANLLKNVVDQIEDPPKSLKPISDTANFIAKTLHTLQKLREEDWTKLCSRHTPEMHKILRKCTSSCTVLRNDLQSWTTHFKEDNLGWLERARVGLLSDRQIDYMCIELTVFGILFETIAKVGELHASARQNSMSRKYLEKVRSATQNDINEAISNTEYHLSSLQDMLNGLGNANDDQGFDEAPVSLPLSKEESERVSEGCDNVSEARRILRDLLAMSREEVIWRVASNMEEF